MVQRLAPAGAPAGCRQGYRGYGNNLPLRRGAIPRYVARHPAAVFLLLFALLTRLPLLSISIDEVDSANFINALTLGYNVPQLRPHPPGYPVYIFMGWLLDGVVNNPQRSLTLLSALLGSLAVVPFHSLLRQMTGGKMALVGSLLFVVNPLFWTFSEAALSDVPSMACGVLLAWLCYKARHSAAAWLWACVVSSIAMGIRQSNLALLLLPAFPLGYRWLALKQRPWGLTAAGLALFSITTATWVWLMISIGSGGLSEYLEATNKQWATAVKIYDYTQVASPWLVNLPIRFERFFFGYFLTYLWTGDDGRTPLTLLLVIPWTLGFALFVTSFSFTSSRYNLTALWIVSIGYTTLTIHFLPRYGLTQMPGFMMACLLGYQFLGSRLVRHPRRVEILWAVGIGSLMMLYGVKYQSPVNTFEFTPPPGSFYAGAMFTGGILFLLLGNFLYHRASSAPAKPAAPSSRWWTSLDNYPRFVLAGLALLVIPFAFKGYALASIAHNRVNPSQELVLYVKEHFDTTRITPCWDNQTHSYFEVLIPGVVPTGYWSIDDLYAAHKSGNRLVVTDRCAWYDEINSTLGLDEVGQFTGASPLWSKAPSIRLYATRPS
jgi:4-amino-4-deoxy-L-arabinose transferase-like glycosyltransferase